MIFVTVGTHEQPFNRLMKEIDKIALQLDGKEEIIVQYGFSTNIPEHVTDAEAFFSSNEMNQLMMKARIIITHGGPSSIIEGIQLKKPVIVVPRQKKFKEHVNNHQFLFAKEMEQMKYPMLVVDNIETLSTAIEKAPELLQNRPFHSHTDIFNRELRQLLGEMFR